MYDSIGKMAKSETNGSYEEVRSSSTSGGFQQKKTTFFLFQMISLSSFLDEITVKRLLSTTQQALVLFCPRSSTVNISRRGGTFLPITVTSSYQKFFLVKGIATIVNP